MTSAGDDTTGAEGAPPETRVLAVIVTFHPDVARLARLVDAMRAQGAAVLVVDNGSGAELAAALAGHSATVLELAENRGIAAAINIGLDRARAAGASHLLTLDQDSTPAPGMMAALLAAEARLTAAGERVAAVGPVHVDPRSGQAAPFVRWEDGRPRFVQPEPPAGTVASDYLISSGALMPLAALEAVGGMREDLFIDGVDLEWCLRARSLGWSAHGAAAARLEHTIGDRVVRLAGRPVAVHAPVRVYYGTRNLLALARLPYLPRGFRRRALGRLVLKAVFQVLLVPPRLTRLRMLAAGLRDGLAGRMGPQGEAHTRRR